MKLYKFFTVTLFIQLILRIINIWVDIRYWLISIGLDTTHLEVISSLKRNTSIHTIDSLGKSVGSIIGVIIIFVIYLGLVQKRKWAMICVVIPAVIGLGSYIGGMKALLSFYMLLSRNVIWPGYFLFGGIIVINVIYSMAVVFYFSRYLVKNWDKLN